MFNLTALPAKPLARCRPLLALLLPLALAPLASCAQDTYLAQNYQTTNPGYSPPTYSTQPPAYVANAPDAGQFLAPPQLAELVSRIALYPDDLIGIILPASTYPLQVVQAARYLDEVRANSTLAPDDSWDNSVVALLNYPDVVNMMNRDLAWTERLGQAVVLQQADIINAIGQFRSQAQAAGNLRSDERQLVELEEGAIRIRPANPQVIYVPQYEPTRVIVYQSEPVFRYYPRPCPVYYYNYSSGYPSGFSNFWGVSTMFTIGWSSRRVHMHDYDYYDDPRYDQPYNGYFYRRSRHDWHDDDNDGRWRDGDRHEDHEGYGPGRPPRERDWHPGGGRGPRPMGVGNGGRGRDDDGRDHDNGGGQGRPFVGPIPHGGSSVGRQDRNDREPRGGTGAGTPSRGDFPRNNGGRGESRNMDPPQDRRFSQPMPARTNETRRADPPQDERFTRPVPPRPNAVGRGDPPQDRSFSRPVAPREITPRLADPPQDRRFSRPVPSSDMESRIRQIAPNANVGPSRSVNSDNRVRNNVREVTPSREETRSFSSTREARVPAAREAPSRQESRAHTRNDDGPTPSRRGNDDDRGRNNRDR